MPVHVTIHDVSPAWAREVDVALDLCHEEGIKPSLLVVPDFHGKAPLDKDAAYQGRLRALEADGHEVYLHGYYHRSRAWEEHAEATGASRGSVAGRVRHLFAQRVVSGGEAEFSDVSREEAVDRLVRGEQMLADAGLTIRGFVAPAWSMPRWVLDMLGDRGYGFAEDHLRVYDPANRTSRASVVLNFASRSPGRLFSTVAYCRAARPARRLLPARVALHPADMRFALLRNETVSLLRWAKDDVVARGRDLLA